MTEQQEQMCEIRVLVDCNHVADVLTAIGRVGLDCDVTVTAGANATIRPKDADEVSGRKDLDEAVPHDGAFIPGYYRNECVDWAVDASGGNVAIITRGTFERYYRSLGDTEKSVIGLKTRIFGALSKAVVQARRKTAPPTLTQVLDYTVPVNDYPQPQFRADLFPELVARLACNGGDIDVTSLGPQGTHEMNEFIAYAYTEQALNE